MNQILDKTGVTWEEIQKATDRLKGVAFPTPVLRSRYFDERCGCYMFFKAENMQRSGSVRFRGVFNRIKAYLEKEGAQVLVAYSSGNHAQAVALTAKLLGLRSILLLPDDAGPAKVAAALEYGAEIEYYDRHRENPAEIARKLAKKSGTLLVSPQPRMLSIAGCATVVVELLEEIHDLQALVLPFEADDLLAGCALAARRIIPGIQIYGVEAVRQDNQAEILIPNLDVWSLIDGMLNVREEEIINMQLLILERMKLLVEPSGALAASAVCCRKGDFAGKRVGVLLASGNADFHKLSVALSSHIYPKRSAQKELPKELYRTECFSCRETFNAMEAAFCNCLAPERTLVCPGCLSCFCRAPSTYKDRFWENAPQGLWDREAEEHRSDSAVRPNPEPFEVIRPLVLIVDDDERTRKMAIKVIEGLGYGAVIAADGESGLRMARKYMPDLVLTDALMPRMDGREMCRRLKEDPATARIKVVITTSLYTQSKYRTEAFKQFHVDEYLSKPLSFNELRNVLQKYME